MAKDVAQNDKKPQNYRHRLTTDEKKVQFFILKFRPGQTINAGIVCSNSKRGILSTQPKNVQVVISPLTSYNNLFQQAEIRMR